MKATILVLSVDEAPRLARSLPLAAAQAGLGELVVIDDACTDDTVAVARAAGARVIALGARRPYAAAINAGLAAVREADADAVLLLNADCYLGGPGFLQALLARLEDDPGVGSVAPKLVREADPGLIDAAGMSITRWRKNGLVGHGEPAWRYATPGEVFGPDGACALYRTAALDSMGGDGLDERMGLWATDADLAWRLRRHGWRCAYEPRAVAVHERTYSPSTRALVDPAHRRLQFRNRLLMLGRNERRADLRRDLGPLLGYEALALGHVLLREQALLGAYADAARVWRAVRRERPRGGTAAVPFGLEPPR